MQFAIQCLQAGIDQFAGRHVSCRDEDLFERQREIVANRIQSALLIGRLKVT